MWGRTRRGCTHLEDNVPIVKVVFQRPNGISWRRSRWGSHCYGFLQARSVCPYTVNRVPRGLCWGEVAVIDNMLLLSALPPPPQLPEPNTSQAHAIFQNGYLAARDIVNLGWPDLHRVRYHQECILLELVPLLNAIFKNTSDPATLSWCRVTVAAFADLYACLTQCETSAQSQLNSNLSLAATHADRIH